METTESIPRIHKETSERMTLTAIIAMVSDENESLVYYELLVLLEDTN